MAEGDIHVTRDRDDWVVTIEGIKGTLVKHATFEEAVEVGARVAAAARSQLRVHEETERLAASS